MSRRTRNTASAQSPSSPDTSDVLSESSESSPSLHPLSNASPSDAKSIRTAQTTLLTRPPSEIGHFSTLRALQAADYITLLNGFSGCMSVLNSMRYCLATSVGASTAAANLEAASKASFGTGALGGAGGVSPLTFLWTALAWMPAGLFFDFMDGKVARWRGGGEGSLLGQELDSLADLVSFGLAPAAAAFAMGLRSTLDCVLLTVFVLSGLTRLARFNVTTAYIPRDAGGKSKYFEGLPIPTSLTIAAGMAFALTQGWIEDAVPGGVLAEGTMFEVHPVAGLFVLWSSFMLSRSLHVPKL